MVEILRLHHGDDGAKNLLVEAVHVFGDVHKDVGPHEDAFGSVSHEVLRSAVRRDGSLAPELRGAAGLGHLNAGEEILGVFLGKHGAVEYVLVDQ